MNVIDKLTILLKFFELGNHIIVNNKRKVYMKTNGQLVISKGKKEQKFDPAYSELIKLVKSIDDTVYNKIVNVVNNGGDTIVK